MKKVVLLLVFCLSIFSVNAKETDCTKYLEELTAQDCNCKVDVNSTKEFSQVLNQEFSNSQIYEIRYGFGDIKCKKQRKKKISYVAIYDKDCKPVWGQIIYP